MAEYVTDFNDFLEQVGKKQIHEVVFSVNNKEYSTKYQELSSAEENSVLREFERWFKDNFSDEARKEKNATLQQFRYFKMLKNHMDGLKTFDDFLALPRTVMGAMVVSIEEDLMLRYPHIMKQYQAAMGKMPFQIPAKAIDSVDE